MNDEKKFLIPIAEIVSFSYDDDIITGSQGDMGDPLDPDDPSFPGY